MFHPRKNRQTHIVNSSRKTITACNFLPMANIWWPGGYNLRLQRSQPLLLWHHRHPQGYPFCFLLFSPSPFPSLALFHNPTACRNSLCTIGWQIPLVFVPRGVHLGRRVAPIVQRRHEEPTAHWLVRDLLERRYDPRLESRPQHGHQHHLPAQHLQQRESLLFCRPFSFAPSFFRTKHTWRLSHSLATLLYASRHVNEI